MHAHARLSRACVGEQQQVGVKFPRAALSLEIATGKIMALRRSLLLALVALSAAAARGPLTELHAAGLGALASPAGAAGAVAAATAAVKWLGAAGGG